MNGFDKAIGLFTSRIDNNYNMNIWSGIYNGARSRNYNLITYRGGSIKYDPTAGRIKNNVVYDNVDFEQIGGFILVSTSISNEISPDAFEEFCSRINPKPIVSIGSAPEFVNKCMIDNSSGFYNLVCHLIKDHGCKSFVYLGGPKMGKEAVIRHDAFRKALADNNLNFNEELLYYGEFQADKAKDGIKEIAAKNIKFDAVVAANDDMAISASVTLQEMGYKIPDDVKIIGFDDVPNALTTDPPLSTVRQPIYSQAFRAANMLIDLIENKKTDKVEYIQTMTVIRQSCGCGRHNADKKKASTEFKKEFSFDKRDSDEIIGNMQYLMKNFIDVKKMAVVEELIGLFHNDLAGNGRSYLDKLRDIINAVDDLNEIDIWQEILMNMEKGFLKIISRDKFEKFNELTDGQEKLTSERIMRIQSQKYAFSNQENRNLREILQGLGFSFEINAIHDFMSKNFRNYLNISSGYLILFEDDTAEECRIIAGFDENGKLDLGSCREPYQTKFLIHNGKNNLSKDSYYVCPINFNDRDIGMIILQIGSYTGFIYESVSSQLVSSIWGSFLLKESSESEKSITRRNKKIESLVKPMIELIKQVTDTIDDKMKIIAALNQLSKISSDKISETSGVIQSISEKFNEMMNIINIIDDISATVKLVSINASIEATHAGQFGSGFNVIAREIKKLSESTKKNAENISLTLRSVIDMIKFSIDASRDSAEAFREQDKSVNEILNSMKIISDNMKNLNESSNEILTVMEKNEEVIN